jgi:hypothetical protein
VILKITLALAVFTTFPPASSIVTTGWVPNAAAAVLLVPGCVVNARLVAVLAATVTDAVPVFPPDIACITLG